MADDDTTTSTTDSAADTSEDATSDDSNAGGEADKDVDYQARFEAQQKINRDLERKFKVAAAAADKVAGLEESLAKLQGKEKEYLATKDAQRVKDEALAAANDRILKAEVRAAAATKLADPQDAIRFLDMSEFEVGSDGEVDASKVAKAVDDLIESKPYLAAQRGKRFEGGVDGGARKDASRPTQLSREDLKGMSPEAIVAAKAEGRLNDALGIKP